MAMGSEQDAAREYVIKHLASKPLLNIVDPKLRTELHTDASSIGYGAILLLKENNQCRVVSYFSKRTSPAESKYPSYELETLAIFNALKKFRIYLRGINFTIVTDSIKSTMNKRDRQTDRDGHICKILCSILYIKRVNLLPTLIILE